MPDKDNKLGKAKNLGLLGSVPISKVDRLNSTDLDDLYRFRLDGRNSVDLSLLANGAKVGIELYALKSSLSQVLGSIGKIDFRKLRGKALKSNLQLVSASGRGDLPSGEYFVRVLQRKGSSPYQFKLSAKPIIIAPPLDTQAPTGSARAASLVTTGSSTYDFTIGYSDNIGIDVSSLDNNDIQVTGPNGFAQLATVVSANDFGSTYRINAPGGSWDFADNGNYNIALQGNQVRDRAGNSAAASNLSSFSVAIGQPPLVDVTTPVTPPVITPVTPPVITPVTPPVITPITPPVITPITPPIKPPAKSVKARISRIPNGDTHIAELDFSKSKDENPAEDKGRFEGAVMGRIKNLDSNEKEQTIPYLAGNLISFINADGQTEYQAKLRIATGSNEGSFGDLGGGHYDSLSYDALFIKFILPAFYEADPDSLSFLQKAFKEAALNPDGEFEGAYGEEFEKGVYFGYGTGSKDTTFDSNDLYLYSSGSMEMGDNNDYIELGNHYNYGFTSNELDAGKGNDTIYAGNSYDDIDGEEDNDLLYGRAGNDSLYGGKGNDSLYGGDGDDTLNGFISRDDVGTISGEQFDYLTGGNGSDYFVLGDPNKVFYHGAGDGYAVIEDWDHQSDFIQTRGDASQYRLEFKNVIGSTALDTEIYYASGAINDRIAIVKDTTNVIFSRDFRFV